MPEPKRLIVTISKVEDGYEISFQLPREVLFTHALQRGFETEGQTARVRINATAILVDPKAENWLIHHEDNAAASPEKVVAEVRNAMERWIGDLGYEIDFHSE